VAAGFALQMGLLGAIAGRGGFRKVTGVPRSGILARSRAAKGESGLWFDAAKRAGDGGAGIRRMNMAAVSMRAQASGRPGANRSPPSLHPVRAYGELGPAHQGRTNGTGVKPFERCRSDAGRGSARPARLLRGRAGRLALDLRRNAGLTNRSGC
jgi:hypothetical protein